MIVPFCMLIVFALSHCDDLPSRIEVESSINRTINEVERLIRQNSSLPNLSRYDIVDILSNITSKEIETYEDKGTINKARDIYKKALMVVLPYNAEDSKEDIQDLYSKPPIVKMIADPSYNTETWKNERLQPTTQETQRDKQPFENLVVTHASERISPKESQLAKTRYKNHRETYSDVHTKAPLKETLKFDLAPIKFTFNLDNLQRQSTTSERSVSTSKRAVLQTSSPSSKDEDAYVVYSTDATTVRTVGSSPRNVLTNNNLKGSQTTPYPSKYNKNILSADQWRYNAPTSTVPSPTMLTKVSDSSLINVLDKQPFLPTVTSPLDIVAPISTVSSNSKTTLEPMKEIKIRQDTNTTNIEQPVSIYVTPTSSTLPSSSAKSRYSSTYSLNSGGFRRVTTTTSTTMRPEVMDLLASIGLRPENATNVEEIFERNKESLRIKSEIPNSNGFIHKKTSGLTALAPDTPSIVAQNTFESPVSEIGKGMNNLTPDVQLLFQRFGLQTSNTATSTTSTTLRPTVNTNSYTNFKPLPTSRIKNEDMKEFLAQFGLGVGDSRQKKAMPVSTQRPSLIEAVPNNMRQILENIGLISRKVTKSTSKVENVVPKTETKFHVFKPHETRVKDEGQRIKINELLDTIRLVQEGKASATDVRKAADDLLLTTKTLKDGPDPLSLEEIVKIYNEDVKNEVKRQQKPEDAVSTATNDGRDLENATSSSSESIDNVSSTTISTTSTTTITSTGSDSAKDGSDFLGTLTPVPESSTSAGTNLVALEESFGGSTRAPDSILPTKRKNGLYFLVDWNTFLEVGEENSEKVNLRFQPKVGDRTRFLPVNVP